MLECACATNLREPLTQKWRRQLAEIDVSKDYYQSTAMATDIDADKVCCHRVLHELEFHGQPYSLSVLKVGYCLSQPDGTFRADCTISLVTGPRTILVDTGGSWDRDFLRLKLKEKDLEPADVSYVIGTHGHSDHVGNLNLFPLATTIVGFDISQGDTYLPNKLAEGQAYSIDEYVRHSNSHTSVGFFHLPSRQNDQNLNILIYYFL